MHARVSRGMANTLALNTLASRGKSEAVKSTMRKLEKA